MAKEIVVTLANGDKAGETLKQLTHQAAALKKEISGLKPGTEDFAKSAASLNSVKDRMADIDKQVKSTTQSSNAFKGALGGVLNQIPGFSQLSGALGAARGGVGGLTSGFGLLKGAIIATGLGALVIAIVGLVSWFSKTEAGANMISGAMKGMGAVIDTLMGRLFNLGDTLKQLFSNPIQFFKDLGKDIAESAKEGYNFVQVMDDIEDRQRDLSVRTAENELAIDRMLTQAKNVGKSYEERLGILDRVTKLTRETYQEELKLSKESLDAIEANIKAEMKRQGVTEMTGENAQKITDAKLAYIALLGKEQQIEDRVANFKEKLFDKEEKAQLKSAKDAAKNVENQDLALQGEIERADLANAQELERTQKQEDALNAIYDASRAKKAAEDQIAFDKQKALDDQAIQERMAKAQFEKQLGDFNLETQRQVTAGLGDLIAQNIKDEQAAKVVKKSFALIDIGIRLSQELSANALSAAANPLNAVSFGAAGAAQLAASNARSLILAAINTAKVLAFDKGGYTGDGGKYDPAGVVHKGEVVWSQADVAQFGGVRAVEAIRPTSRMNGYYNGGPVSPFKNNTGRAPIPSGNAGGGSPMGFDMDGLIDAIDKRIIRTVGTLKVQNVVTETQDAMKVVNSIRDEANV
jgi:hypothetical protein